MDKEITLKYIGYARKSSEDNKERQAASLPDQLFIIEGLKSRYNLNVADILQESKSAYSKGREVFEEMLQRIEKGQANAILIWHPNRLARNMSDGGRVIDLIDEKKLIEIRTPSRIYRNSPEDKFLLGLEFSISKKDSDDKSLAVKRGLEKKIRDGWRPSEGPQGYLPDKLTESGQRKIYADKERLQFIKKIFELFRGGTSVNEICRIAEDDWGYRTRQRKRCGGKPLTISMIYSILNNAFYTGRYEYPVGSDHWYQGKHETIITPELFNEVQVLLGHRSQYKLKHHQYAYTSLMKCGFCASSITAEEKWQIICSSCKLKFSLTKKNEEICPGCQTRIDKMKKPTILHYIYYRCTRRKNPACRERGLRVDLLENQVGVELSGIEIPECFVDWALDQIRILNNQEKDFREDTISSIKRAHDDARAKLDNLLQLKISPMNKDGSLLSDEKFKAEKTTLEAEIKNLENQLATVDQRMLQVASEIDEKFTFAARANNRFTTGDLKTKRDIVLKLGSHLILENKTLRFDNPFIFLAIKKMKQEAPVLQKALAPDLRSVPITEMDAFEASIPTLLRSQESHLA